MKWAGHLIKMMRDYRKYLRQGNKAVAENEEDHTAKMGVLSEERQRKKETNTKSSSTAKQS